MDKPKDKGYTSNAQERDEIFDERTAIRIAIQEMKEQTRMDYDLYLESRRLRNEQINIMLDRLRELDHRDEIVELKYKRQLEEIQKQDTRTLTSNLNEKVVPNKEGIDNSAEALTKLQKRKEEQAQLKLKEVRENVSSNIKEERLSNPIRGSLKRVSSERIETLIVTYLRGNGEVSLKAIKGHVESEVNTQWKNFGDVMQKIMSHNKRVKRASKRGYYYLES